MELMKLPRRTKQMIIDEQEKRIKELEELLDIQYQNYDSLKQKYHQVKEDKHVIRTDNVEYKQLEGYKDLYFTLKERNSKLEQEKTELIEIVQELKSKQIKKHNERGAGRQPKVTIQQKESILNLYATGNYSMDKLSKKFNLSKGTIYNVIKESRKK